ncbi:MAG: NAD(P)/FAD-dependent oxidoreductase [Halioglobus sp.]
MSQQKVPHIVIVGGGAGGLILATLLGRRLGRKDLARVTLVDAQLTHIWKPLLHEVAAGSMNPYEDELNYFAQAQRNGFAFQPGRMTGIDREKKHLVLDDMQDPSGGTLLDARTIEYDYLVIAIGSIANDFGTPGARDNCIYLDTREQAERFHRTLLSYYYRAKAKGFSDGSLGIAIIGAGATGVELSAEVNHAARVLKAYGLDEIDPADVKITIIEAADRILPALNERISAGALAELQLLGINVLTSEKVTEVTPRGVATASGKLIPAQIRVWSAGVQAPAVLHDLAGLKGDRGNTLVVDSFLRTDDPFVFAIGDCASCTAKNARGETVRVPPRAQSALQQAKWLARALPRMLQGKAPSVPFVYKDYGSLISLSTYSTIGKLMGNLTGSVNVEGRVARLVYLSLYRTHQATLYGWVRTAVFMLKDLLGRSSGPKLKMH